MTDLIGKIVTVRWDDNVWIFRLNQACHDRKELQTKNVVVRESTSDEKKLWFIAYDMAAQKDKDDLGLVFNTTQFNQFLKLADLL